MKLRLAAALLLAAASIPVLAIDSRATVLQNTVRQDGLLPVHVDARGGRILLFRPAMPVCGNVRGALLNHGRSADATRW